VCHAGKQKLQEEERPQEQRNRAPGHRSQVHARTRAQPEKLELCLGLRPCVSASREKPVRGDIRVGMCYKPQNQDEKVDTVFFEQIQNNL